MIVSLNGVIQKPGSSYTISSSTITFSSNLATGDSIDFIYLLGNVLDLGTPSDSTVTTAKLSGNLVTPGTLDVNGQELILDADADTSITADTDDQIDIKVAGADDFQITANTLTALSGSTIKADTIAETTSANGITVDGLNIKDSKLVTANSVIASNITADAIDATKIADNAISEEHLDVTSITGHTAETSIADGDTILIHDASASALRKMTKANFVAGVGGVNTPYFFANAGSATSISNNSMTKVEFTNEVLDTANNFASSRFTPTTAGKYILHYSVALNTSADATAVYPILFINGSENGNATRIRKYHGGSDAAIQTYHTTAIVSANGTGDYYEIYFYQNAGSSKSTYNSTNDTFFFGYKLAE